MKSNLPPHQELPKISTAEAMKKPGLYFVTSAAGKAQVASVGIVPMVCIMMVSDDGTALICNPTQRITEAQMTPGLVFHGPVQPPV